MPSPMGWVVHSLVDTDSDFYFSVNALIAAKASSIVSEPRETHVHSTDWQGNYIESN